MATVASANSFLIVSRSTTHKAIAEALSLYVGNGRRYSVRQLHEATGVPERQIECAKIDPEGRQASDWRALKLEEFISLAKFLGEGFTSEALSLAGQGAYALPEDELPHPHELVRDCAEDTAEIAAIAADDQPFDDRDVRALRNLGHDFVERGMNLVASLRRRERRA